MPFAANADLDDAWTHYNGNGGAAGRQEFEAKCYTVVHDKGKKRRRERLRQLGEGTVNLATLEPLILAAASSMKSGERLDQL